jgi:predicted metal-binding membrane protein
MASTAIRSSIGLIRPSTRGGFCPACRLIQSGDVAQEIAPPALIALALLIVAAAAWALTIARSHAMDDMGLGAFGPFVASWSVMLAAMMLPAATPLLFEFARNAEGRQRWQAATALCGATYLGVWLAFGGVCYLTYNAVGMPWPNQQAIGGVALVMAGFYAFTPLKRACETWCRELRVLHGPLPFNLMHSALFAGLRYGLSCVGCNAVLMLAMLLIGLSNLAWMIVVTGVMLASRFAPARVLRWSQLALSSALVAAGLLYMLAA